MTTDKTPVIRHPETDLTPADHSDDTENEENGDERSRNGFIGPQLNGSIKGRTASGVTDGTNVHDPGEEEEFRLRHGWDSQYLSEEHLHKLTQAFFMYFTGDRRYESSVNSKKTGLVPAVPDWRMKDRLKTVSALLAICLNIGVDPPDMLKTNPCARLECWIDPLAINTAPGHNSPMNSIGKALQTQYETLSMRTRYKALLDPTQEDLKKYATTLRRNARDERVMFHYNGHGVPRPTASGEIWVFNKNYTQYIPTTLYDLQSWLGAPSLYIWDCAAAGLIVENFFKYIPKLESDFLESAKSKDPNASGDTPPNYAEAIHVAACRANERLPTNPELPADIFTCCLTAPIDMALRFFVMQNQLPSNVQLDPSFRLPGRLSERRTPLGELNWIFTAITDTIAWNAMSKPVFRRLFRQDLMVAAIFRNFLLAQRIMRVYNCHPVSYPEIPDTHDDPLWKNWDLAVEMTIAQLPQLLAADSSDLEYVFQHSDFFKDQLTAFEKYIDSCPTQDKQPQQLPIVLQVLLSQQHRLRALILLSKFLDLGPWTVNLALSIGIFPYVLKLLQSQAVELRPVMVFIWARILAVDHSVQQDLLKDNGYNYFVSILDPTSAFPNVNNEKEHRAMSAFIIAEFCRGFRQAQVVSLSPELLGYLLHHTKDSEGILRQWACLCLSMLWHDFADAKWAGIRAGAHNRLPELILDPVPDVRTAALHAMTSFFGIPDLTDQVAAIEEALATRVLEMGWDGSVMVRRELVVFYSTFIHRYLSRFIVTAFEEMREERDSLFHSQDDKTSTHSGHNRAHSRSGRWSSDESTAPLSQDTIFMAVWKQIVILAADPAPDVAYDADIVMDHVANALFDSPLGEHAKRIIDDCLEVNVSGSASPQQQRLDSRAPSRNPSRPTTPTTESFTPKELERSSSYFSLGLRRTASMAASLKNLAFGSTAPTSVPLPTPPKSPTTRSNATSLGPRSRLPAEWSAPPDESDSTSANKTQPRPYLPFPTPRDFKERLESSSTDPPPKFPLKSNFYEWSTDLFRQPQMKRPEAEEPGSVEHNARLRRQDRNEHIIYLTQPLKVKAVAKTARWDYHAGLLQNATGPPLSGAISTRHIVKMAFHQFENHLVVCDNQDGVGVWDWKNCTRLSTWSNGNPTGSRITSCRLINEDDSALLLTGSSDGVVKVFKDYASQNKVEVVTAFRALTDLIPSTKNAGLVFDFLQSRGLCLVAGDVRLIRVWNVGTETLSREINARSGSCVTSLTSDQVEGHVFAAGFGDGAVRIFDQRAPRAEAMQMKWKEHQQWVTGVHLQRGGHRELVSASRSGQVKLWDIRMKSSLTTIDATTGGFTGNLGAGGVLRTMATHEHCPVVATGTDRHQVRVFDLDSGRCVSGIDPMGSGMWDLGYTKKAPIAGTTFHPHRLFLAVSAVGESHVNLYKCDAKK